MTAVEEWVRACDSKSLRDGDMLDFDHGDCRILLARAGGQVYAVDRTCTHAEADLATGFLNEEERTVTCPLHLSVFRLSDGVPQNLPATVPLRIYKVKIQDGAIYIKTG